MKFVNYFSSFLEKEVNLNSSRIDLLDERVQTITNFLKNNLVFKEHFLDTIPQGSYAHKTIIKPVQDYHEFDADLLLYLKEFDNWEAENYVEELYKVFRASPIYREMVSRKTRCVVINYEGDFHIDIVPYLQRHGKKYVTNRHENLFELTDPENYNSWLDEKNRIANHNLIKVIRLVKYLRNYKTTFSIKSIVLNVLLGERVNEVALLEDPNCYQDVPSTLRTVMNKLKEYLEQNYYLPTIIDPSNTGENFSDRWNQEGYSNFRKWIIHYAKKIEDAFNEQDKDESLLKWQEVFGNCFKAPNIKESTRAIINRKGETINYTEKQITDLGYNVNLNPEYRLKVDGNVLFKPGFREYLLSAKGNIVEKDRKIRFFISKCTVPKPYKIYWKVLNRGSEAIEWNCIRGNVIEGNDVWFIDESTSFRGNHWVECYIVKDGICVAKNRQQVIIK